MFMGKKPKHSPVEALGVFNEQADKLESLGFTRTVISEPLTFNIRYDSEKGGGAWRTGPGDESIDAFVLTFRQFFQNNDAISFQNIAGHYDALLADSVIPESLAEEYGETRAALNRFLDAETYMNHNDRQLTHRYILDVFLYGALAHTDKEKRAVYHEWQAVPIFFPMVKREFTAVMREVLAVIFGMRGINRRVLAEIRAEH